MGLYRNEIRDAMIAAIRAYGSSAGGRVFEVDAWPLAAQELPAVLLSAPHERKESLVRAAPSFTVTATIIAIARVAGTNQADVKGEIDLLCEQIERAVLTDQILPQMVQQFSSVETQVVLNSEGRQYIAEATISFAAEFGQFFEPIATDDLLDIEITLTSINPIVITGDLVMESALVSNVSDASNLTAGMSISGPGVQPNTTIRSIASNGSLITLSQAATATGSTVLLNCTNASAPQPSFDVPLPQ